MTLFSTFILGAILILSSLGVILARKPIYSSLSFLLTLLALASIYLTLSAEFISVMQVLVYAGAILVIFMFVIVLFQDAHQQISHFKANSAPILLFGAASVFTVVMVCLSSKISGTFQLEKQLPEDFGTAEALGKKLYVDFFFPFEAVILLFLVAVVGALYIGRKEN